MAEKKAVVLAFGDCGCSIAAKTFHKFTGTALEDVYDVRGVGTSANSALKELSEEHGVNWYYSILKGETGVTTDGSGGDPAKHYGIFYEKAPMIANELGVDFHDYSIVILLSGSGGTGPAGISVMSEYFIEYGIPFMVINVADSSMKKWNQHSIEINNKLQELAMEQNVPITLCQLDNNKEVGIDHYKKQEAVDKKIINILTRLAIFLSFNHVGLDNGDAARWLYPLEEEDVKAGIYTLDIMIPSSGVYVSAITGEPSDSEAEYLFSFSLDAGDEKFALPVLNIHKSGKVAPGLRDMKDILPMVLTTVKNGVEHYQKPLAEQFKLHEKRISEDVDPRNAIVKVNSGGNKRELPKKQAPSGRRRLNKDTRHKW